ncbi:MAG: hypothetical protein WCG82_10675 [Bacteroidota bacterium]
MRYFATILAVCLFGIQLLFAQDVNKLKNFREQSLLIYKSYFVKADTTTNGILNLYAKEEFAALTDAAKKELMTQILTNWEETKVMVQSGTNTELWGKDGMTGNIILLEQLDINSSFYKTPELIGVSMHPWFIYLGLQLGVDNTKNVNMALNTRFGFFLLKSRWDLGTSISAGFTGNIDSKGTGYVNIGLSSKVYFPIRKIGLNPNIGAEVSMALFGDTPAEFNYSLILGLSWYIGIGSIDFGVNIGNIITGSGGITIMPGNK